MIEIRLRAAESNPSSRPWRLGLSLATLVVFTVAPVVTSRAQDASSRSDTAELQSLRGLKAVTIEGGRTISIDAGDAISITSGSSSITMKRDGRIIIKGTEIIFDGPQKGSSTRASDSSQGSLSKSEIF